MRRDLDAEAGEHLPHLANEVFFRDKPGVLLFIIDAHRAAHHDEKIDTLRCRQFFTGKKTGGVDRKAVFHQPGFDAAKSLERHMLQVVSTHWGSFRVQ